MTFYNKKGYYPRAPFREKLKQPKRVFTAEDVARIVYAIKPHRKGRGRRG